MYPEDKLSFWAKLWLMVVWFFTDERHDPKIKRFKVGGLIEYCHNAIFFVNVQSIVGNDKPFVRKGRVPARFLYVKASRFRWGVPVAYELIFEELNPEKNDFGLTNKPYLIHLSFSLSYTLHDLMYAGFNLPSAADALLAGMVELERFRDRLRNEMEKL